MLFGLFEGTGYVNTVELKKPATIELTIVAGLSDE